MPITVRLLEDEPIIIATLEGRVTVNEFVLMFHEVVTLAEQVDGPVYRITDASYVDTNFAELMEHATRVIRNRAEFSPDPRVRPLLVGTSSLVKLAADRMTHRHLGGSDLPLFRRLDDALHYIRAQLADQRARQPA